MQLNTWQVSTTLLLYNGTLFRLFNGFGMCYILYIYIHVSWHAWHNPLWRGQCALHLGLVIRVFQSCFYVGFSWELRPNEMLTLKWLWLWISRGVLPSHQQSCERANYECRAETGLAYSSLSVFSLRLLPSSCTRSLGSLLRMKNYAASQKELHRIRYLRKKAFPHLESEFDLLTLRNILRLSSSDFIIRCLNYL